MTNHGNELEEELKQLLRVKYPDEVESFELMDYQWAHGTPLGALLYRELFWPTFVEIDGMVFWKEMIDANGVERVHSAYERYGQDKTLTERSFNFIEVPELFAKDPEDVSGELLDELARTLCETWKARLESTFPEKRFAVDFEPANDDTGEECGLWFYQVSS